MVLLIVPNFCLPMPIFAGSGHLSSTYLTHATQAMAERMLEHRRGTDRYHDAVAYTSWKIARHIRKDLGYKLWAVYNDCTTLYVTYWKLCYLCAAVSRVVETLASSSG